MQRIECPGCGAPVEFASTASVMAVCRFCKTTLLKDAASVRNLGKMADVLEDYSPLQIGTGGRFGNRAFSLVGRIQLRYSAGFWNEWYLAFEDGANGWLSDASGQYAVSFVKDVDSELPLFDKLVPGRTLQVSGQAFITSDVRKAQCTAGEGELPFQVGAGWQARVADFRSAEHFLSLDYPDAGPPRVYLGRAVSLEDLKPQRLRDVTDLKDAAGRFKGKVSQLDCPSCGAPVSCVPGVTVHILCAHCGAQIDTAGATAEVLAAGAALERVPLTLTLGAEAVVGGSRFTVLGAMRRAEVGTGYTWTEYLLYAPGRTFQWVIETDAGWQRAEVLDRWPAWDGAGSAVLDGVGFSKNNDYDAQVTFAAGSFNWRVKAGDRTRVTEFAAGARRLAAEASSEELTWSQSTPLPLDQLRAWFGGRVHVDEHPHPTYRSTARRMLIALFCINVIPVTIAPYYALTYALLGAAAIYIPAYLLDRIEENDG